ncbi:amidohydrolase family protein [Gracilibacillus salinarum]|uniref:Amidohydrolase family protein n=1 Tax=Gracilibacillus salinarum TaxID=2932255 RepID=A0ABY4GGC0_9BACI|nr:amidohydrolase family protein [Gracilibacillus salinarum]UOQ83366.1 amidohydrolase family protein [Gracilibacillus salinarum]
MSQSITLFNASVPLRNNGQLYSITIRDGVYQQVKEQTGYVKCEGLSFQELENNFSQAMDVDLEGRIVLPSFVDIHTHLDKAYSLKEVPNKSGTLLEAIENYHQKAHTFTPEMIKRRVYRQALESLSYGTTHIRTHVNFEMNISPKLALDKLAAVIEVKEALRDLLTIQIVPMLSDVASYTKEQYAVIQQAMELGIDGIGGAPHLRANPEENIDALIRLAVENEKFLDLHVDENDDPAVCTIETLIEKTIAYDMQGQVTAGHLCSLAAMNHEKAARLIEGMAEASIHAVTLPGANMYLQGRFDQGVIRRGVTRIKELINGGVTIATASDNVHDPFHPFGRGDLVQIGLLTAYAGHLASEAELLHLLRMMTTIPGSIFGLEHEIKEGAVADLVVIDSVDMYDLFASMAPTRYLFTKNRWLNGFKTVRMMNDPFLQEAWRSLTATSIKI